MEHSNLHFPLLAEGIQFDDYNATQVRQKQDQAERSDMGVAMDSLGQGISGLLFAVSIIFLFGAPLISTGIVGLLVLAHAGKTMYNSALVNGGE